MLAGLLAACGSGGEREPADAQTSDGREAGSAVSGDRRLVAALGDSITAGSPLWDPDPAFRDQLGPGVTEESQYGFWAERSNPGIEVRNCGVWGERTDEIARRLDSCADGAQILLVQGGINDIAQGRPVAEAAADLRAMVQAGKREGLEVLIADVLPWNNGHPRADAPIAELNRLIGRIGRREDVPVLPFHETLEDPERPGLMVDRWTIDGDHPSVEGYRRIGERAFRLP